MNASDDSHGFDLFRAVRTGSRIEQDVSTSTKESEVFSVVSSWLVGAPGGREAESPW